MILRRLLWYSINVLLLKMGIMMILHRFLLPWLIPHFSYSHGTSQGTPISRVSKASMAFARSVACVAKANLWQIFDGKRLEGGFDHKIHGEMMISIYIYIIYNVFSDFMCFLAIFRTLAGIWCDLIDNWWIITDNLNNGKYKCTSHFP